MNASDSISQPTSKCIECGGRGRVLDYTYGMGFGSMVECRACGGTGAEPTPDPIESVSVSSDQAKAVARAAGHAHGQIAFLLSCIASGERLNAVDELNARDVLEELAALVEAGK